MKDPRTCQLYNVMQSVEGRLGGGEGIEGIYGSITATGMQKVLDCLQHNCGLDGSSALVDIGAGLGRPLLHALVSHGVCRTYGVELDRVKVAKACAFTQQTLQQLQLRGVELPGGMASEPIITCASIEQVASLEPATHAYSFWEGVPRTGKAAFGRLFRESKTLKAVAVVQRAIRQQDPCIEMRQLGFGPLLLIKSFTVSMSGSGRSFTAYVFSKVAPSAAAFLEGRTPGSVAAKQLKGIALQDNGSESDADSQQKGQCVRIVALCTARVPLSPTKRVNAAGCDDSPSKKQKSAAGGQQQPPTHSHQSQQPAHAYGLRPKRLMYAQQACSMSGAATSNKENQPAGGDGTSVEARHASAAGPAASSAPVQEPHDAQSLPCTSAAGSKPAKTARQQQHKQQQEEQQLRRPTRVQRGDAGKGSTTVAAVAVAAAAGTDRVRQAVITEAFGRQAPKLQQQSKPGQASTNNDCKIDAAAHEASAASGRAAAAGVQQARQQQCGVGGRRSKR